jgi:hypothetical protein
VSGSRGGDPKLISQTELKGWGLRSVSSYMARHAYCAFWSTTQYNLQLINQILQLTSLLPTAEHFSILLRDALKAQVSLH